LKTWEKIALATGGIITVAGVIYLASKVTAAAKKYLVIESGEGGTTDPPPGRYMKNAGETLTIKAIPNAGFTVGIWVVDGVEVARQIDSISVTMDADHTVIVTFWEGGTPPPALPAGIKSLGSVTVLSNVAAWISGTPCIDQHIHVAHVGNNWEGGKVASYPLKFQVFDAYSKGIPNVDVALWTDAPPDTGRYRGTTLLDGTIHTSNNPLIKKTDAYGVVSAEVGYLYGLNDRFETLCNDAGLRFQIAYCPIPAPSWPMVPRECLGIGTLSAVVNHWGECETGKSGCEGLGSFQLNRVYAQVVGTALATAEWAYCGFRVKWV
jgi:hypothetical protein